MDPPGTVPTVSGEFAPPGAAGHAMVRPAAHLRLAPARAGRPARTVMEVLGHSQINLTMNTYAHVMPEMKRDAAAMNRLLTANG